MGQAEMRSQGIRNRKPTSLGAKLRPSAAEPVQDQTVETGQGTAVRMARTPEVQNAGDPLTSVKPHWPEPVITTSPAPAIQTSTAPVPTPVSKPAALEIVPPPSETPATGIESVTDAIKRIKSQLAKELANAVELESKVETEKQRAETAEHELKEAQTVIQKLKHELAKIVEAVSQESYDTPQTGTYEQPPAQSYSAPNTTKLQNYIPITSPGLPESYGTPPPVTTYTPQPAQSYAGSNTTDETPGYAVPESTDQGTPAGYSGATEQPVCEAHEVKEPLQKFEAIVMERLNGIDSRVRDIRQQQSDLIECELQPIKRSQTNIETLLDRICKDLKDLTAKHGEVIEVVTRIKETETTDPPQYKSPGINTATAEEAMQLKRYCSEQLTQLCLWEKQPQYASLVSNMATLKSKMKSCVEEKESVLAARGSAYLKSTYASVKAAFETFAAMKEKIDQPATEKSKTAVA